MREVNLKACKFGGCWKECNEVKSSQLFLMSNCPDLEYETSTANQNGTGAFYETRLRNHEIYSVAALNQPETGFSFSCIYITNFTFS
jgi:hypothetical protein